MTTKMKLGQGLEALFSGQPSIKGGVIIDHGMSKRVPIDFLHSGEFQPRKTFMEEGPAELAKSIAEHGLLQPIVVRPSRTGKGYEIIAGERRWRAAQLAKCTSIDVHVSDIGNEKALAWGLIENLQRQDLDPIEKAEAISRFIREFQFTHEKIASTLGCSRVSITNLLRLLQLSPAVCDLLRAGQLDMGHARCLLAVPSHQQLECARYIVAHQFSVRETEQYIQHVNQKKKKQKQGVGLSWDLINLQEKIANKLGIDVTLKPKNDGSGVLYITFRNPDELSGVLERMGISES